MSFELGREEGCEGKIKAGSAPESCHNKVVLAPAIMPGYVREHTTFFVQKTSICNASNSKLGLIDHFFLKPKKTKQATPILTSMGYKSHVGGQIDHILHLKHQTINSNPYISGIL